MANRAGASIVAAGMVGFVFAILLAYAIQVTAHAQLVKKHAWLTALQAERDAIAAEVERDGGNTLFVEISDRMIKAAKGAGR